MPLSWWSPTRVEAIFWELTIWIPIAALMDEKLCVVCFCCPFFCLLRYLFLLLNPNVLYILFGFGFGSLASSPDASPKSSLISYPAAFPPSLFIPSTSLPWPITSTRASAGRSVSMSYRMARSDEGCGDWCARQSVRAVCDIGWNKSSVVKHAIRLHDGSLQTISYHINFDAGLLNVTVMWGIWQSLRVAIVACGFWYWLNSEQRRWTCNMTSWSQIRCYFNNTAQEVGGWSWGSS